MSKSSFLYDWECKAKAEGRICPECHHAVSKSNWVVMTEKEGIIKSCPTCQYCHWGLGKVGVGGSVRMNNEDREGLDRIRNS